MVIQSLLQLSPGTFLIFYHQNLSKTSSKKADDRAFSFILGVEIGVAVFFLLTYIIINFFITKHNFLNSTFFYVMSGIFWTEAIFSFFFYFRPQKLKTTKKSNGSTQLFIPRFLAVKLLHQACYTKNRSDAIILGIISTALELIFTLPLYIIASISIFIISPNTGFVFMIAYIIIATIPLFVIRTLYRTDHNLAEIQRARVRRKFITKTIISGCFTSLAIITLIIGVNL